MERGHISITREVKIDVLCPGCKYHRPDFKYRFCEHIHCPYIKGMTTFREEKEIEIIKRET